MFRHAILRWQQGSGWGHLALSTEAGAPRFAGFVRMTDPRVLELLAENSPIKADSDMLELHFTVRDDALVAA